MNKYQPPLSLVSSDELDKIIKTSSTEQIAWLSGYLFMSLLIFISIIRYD